jgi:hypothetical protein
MNPKRTAFLLALVGLFFAALWWSAKPPLDAHTAEPAPVNAALATVAEEGPAPDVPAQPQAAAPVDPAVLQAVAAAVAELQKQAEAPPEPQIRTPRELSQLMAAYESNRNNKFEAEEIQAMRAIEPAKADEAVKWDANGDGQIDGAELSAWRTTLAPSPLP